MRIPDIVSTHTSVDIATYIYYQWCLAWLRGFFGVVIPVAEMNEGKRAMLGSANLLRTPPAATRRSSCEGSSVA